MLAALSLARAVGEITLPIHDALILARVSSEVCLPGRGRSFWRANLSDIFRT